MRRLHLAAARFERLEPQTIGVMSDSSWIHLGEPESSWQNRFKTELQFGNFLNCARIIYRLLKPRYTHQELKNLYSRTTFEEFNYQSGERLKYNDNTFDFIFSEHFFEHLFMDEAVELLRECHRILKPHGVIRIVVPDADLRTYEKIEPLGMPNKSVPWSHPDKHKTRWSIYSLPLAVKIAELTPRPIMYSDKYGKFFNLIPSEKDPEYMQSMDKQFIFSLDYIQRIPSLICDGIKVQHEL